MTGRAAPPRGSAAGVVLAAGAGRRFGGPKALVPGWLADRVAALRAGGCDDVVVVLGAGAGEAELLVPTGARSVVCEGWAAGMGASLRAGLNALEGSTAQVALVALVDTPGLTAAAVRRVLDRADGPRSLARATYDGVPGHPVALGRSTWPAVREEAVGDSGARRFLAGGRCAMVECADVADGTDVDERR